MTISVKQGAIYTSATGTKVKLTRVVQRKGSSRKFDGTCNIANVIGAKVKRGTTRTILLDSLRRRYSEA
jgi:hypothetical protein